MWCSFTCFDYFNPAAIPTFLLLSTVVFISHSLDRLLHCQWENNIYDVARRRKIILQSWIIIDKRDKCIIVRPIMNECLSQTKFYFIFAYTSIIFAYNKLTFHLMQWIMQIIVNDIIRNDFSKEIVRIWTIDSKTTITVPLFYLVAKIEQILIYFLHWIISRGLSL